MIVYNLLFLIICNSIIPLSPITPLVYIATPLIKPFLFQQTSLLQLLQLPRIHTQSELKLSIRQAMKQHHPDKGGSTQNFETIKSAKKVLSFPEHPYDRLGISSFPSDKQKDIREQIQNKITVHYIEVGMFFLISLIFSMAVTYKLQDRYLRKYILVVLLIACLSQLYFFNQPLQTTLIDLISNKITLFQQFELMRNFGSVIVAIILCFHSRKITKDKQLLKILPSLITTQPQKVKQSLELLNEFYCQQLKQRQIHQKSFLSKARNYVVKGFSIFCFIMMILSFIR